MKNKKLLLFLSLTAMCTIGVTQLPLNQDNVIVADAYSAATTISEDGFTKTFNPSQYTTQTIARSSVVYDAEEKIVFDTLNVSKTSTWTATNKFQKLNIYFEIPQNSHGTVSIVFSGNQSSRYMYYMNGTTPNTAGTSFVMSSSGTTNAFSASDLTTLSGYDGKYFLGFGANNNDIKVSTFTITLDQDVEENFNGSLKQKFSVGFYDKDESGLATEYEDLKINDVVEGTTIQAPESKPSKSGYRFVEWVDESGNVFDFANTTITANTSLYASWEEVSTVKLTIDYNYEDSVSSTIDCNVGALENDLPEPSEREGFEFVGYYLDANCSEGQEVKKGYNITSDLTVYASWRAVTYANVSFIVDGTDYYQERIITGRTVKNWPNDPTASMDMSFYGWYDNLGNQYNASSVFENDTILTAKFDVKAVQVYNFADYVSNAVVGGESNLVENVIKMGDYKQSGSKNGGTFDNVTFNTYLQGKTIEVNLKYNAEVTFYLSQTGKNKTRKIAVIDEENNVYVTNFEPTQTLGEYKINLVKGKYQIVAYDYSLDSIDSTMFNYYGVKIDYTNADTITSDLNGFEKKVIKTYKLENQAGYTIEGVKAARFVGIFDNVTMSDISYIDIKVTSGRTVEEDGNPSYKEEVVFDDFLYVVYDRLTLSDDANAKYAPKEGRLYCEYIIDNIDETYDKLDCELKVKLVDGTLKTLTSTFDCGTAFAE